MSLHHVEMRLTHRVLLLAQAEGKSLLELHVVVPVIGPHLPGESWKSKWIFSTSHQSQPLASKDTRTSDGATGLMVTRCWLDGLSIAHLQLEELLEVPMGHSWSFGIRGQRGQEARSFQRWGTAAHTCPLSLRIPELRWWCNGTSRPGEGQPLQAQTSLSLS